MKDCPPTFSNQSTRTRGRAGRKKHYDVQQLMDVWVYVQSGMARKNLSALEFCKGPGWRWIGGRIKKPEDADKDTGRWVIEHSVHRETLRRRYQQAVKFLKTESEPYRRLASMRVDSAEFSAVSPVEEWWQRELAAAIARN